jgi:hypothetical protein
MAPAEPSGKRKRPAADNGIQRTSPASRGSNAAVSAAAAAASAAVAAQEAQGMDSYDEQALNQLIAHNNGELQNGGQHNPTETAQAALTHYQVPASFETGHAPGPHVDHSQHFNMDHSFGDLKDVSPQQPQQQQSNVQQASPGGSKPPVGSDEWHRVRRDNHKEGKLLGPIH